MQSQKSHKSLFHMVIGYGKAIFMSKHLHPARINISSFNLFAFAAIIFLIPLYGCREEKEKSVNNYTAAREQINSDEDEKDESKNNFTAAKEQISGNETEEGAIDASIRFVSQRLKFPQNALFTRRHGTDVSINDEGLYIVKSYVETRKDCGPKERRYYTSILRFEKGKWKLERLEF